MRTVLVLGGYGAFGNLVARNLARSKDLKILIAGRDGAKATLAAHEIQIQTETKALLAGSKCNAINCTPNDLNELGVNLIVNASGPFQNQNYDLARAAISARCHYVDLADDRHFVTGINAVDREAKKVGVSIISGASSVPGLSSAVIAHQARRYNKISKVEIGISPGNSFTPGLATTRSILGSIGKPFNCLISNEQETLYAWHDVEQHSFPSFGTRQMSSVDVPDLELIPQHYPSLETIRFRAGLELKPLHMVMVTASKLVAAHVLPSVALFARPAHAIKRALEFLGTDEGGMFVETTGTMKNGKTSTATWHLVATKGDGPYIPTLASAILTRALLGLEPGAKTTLNPGAYPCMNLFTLKKFETEISNLSLNIKCVEASKGAKAT